MMAVPQFEKELKDFLNRNPFRPFVIELDDGHQWVVQKRSEVDYFAGPSALYVEPDDSMHFVEADVVKQIVDFPAS